MKLLPASKKHKSKSRVFEPPAAENREAILRLSPDLGPDCE